MLEYVQRAAGELGPGAACSAGYPDLLVTREQIARLLGEERAARIPQRPDAKEILAWHGMAGKLPTVYDTKALFAELGYTLDVVDIVAARGGEMIVDLNRPLPADFARRFDIVLDTGTCEHCFHIGQAAMNLAALVRKGGYLIQAMPLNSFNHGFYNVNPTWFHDFYPLNGFKMHMLTGVSDIVLAPQLFELPPFARFPAAPPNSVMVVVAQRDTDVPPAVPVQRKYAQNPQLKSR